MVPLRLNALRAWAYPSKQLVWIGRRCRLHRWACGPGRVCSARGARWLGGFGAGKGILSVDIILKDASTQKVLLEVKGSGELKGGGGGGNMTSFAKESIKKTILEFSNKL